ncbi:ankyrin repeat-containing protein ANK1 Ecym_2595 [Eremothecium cymbalariae DBVPG|uniref:Uncharacterized protein n=1 Tax=Eremothecium cymbalariae (strain CBS 270.75 / DBVPG 7215 / KCTC 17166 / NRRL Y-17582) TaxID=931890 RepID=G8JQH6_ERECY|nr:Hypothetical protein Ecym_2595 [Eremothecium cymbalariae DBVPG\
MDEIEGATYGEQLLDASRRNNVDLLEFILEQDSNIVAKLINDTKDPFGNTCLHMCCKYGSWDVLDTILDVDCPIEIDPQNVEGDTPLHTVVKYSEEEPEHGTFIASNLIQVGADPRIKNNSGRKPIELIHNDKFTDLIDLLQSAELAADNKGTAINENEAEVIDDSPEDG